MQERCAPLLRMEFGTRKEQIREDKMMMGCVYFANVVRKEVYSTFGGNVKPVTLSQTITGCNFKTSKSI
eukprot:13261887-Heterocapsa_arctica.AAC.1